MEYYLSLFFMLLLIFEASAQTVHRRFEYKYSFKGPYLAQKNNQVPFWTYSGNAIASEESFRITPSLRSQKGQAWSTNPINFDWWEVEVVFRVNGRGRIGADGLAFWYTAQQGVEGPVFGSSDKWNGLGLFFDSFDNDNKRNNPYIMAMVNDGSLIYDHEHDGLSQQLGGCLRDFRNKPFPIRAKIEYYKNVLTVWTQKLEFDYTSLEKENTFSVYKPLSKAAEDSGQNSHHSHDFFLSHFNVPLPNGTIVEKDKNETFYNIFGFWPTEDDSNVDEEQKDPEFSTRHLLYWNDYQLEEDLKDDVPPVDSDSMNAEDNAEPSHFTTNSPILADDLISISTTQGSIKNRKFESATDKILKRKKKRKLKKTKFHSSKIAKKSPIQIHSGMTESEKDYELCLRSENVFLPPSGHFGISAATGGLADDHDVLRFVVNSLRSSEEMAHMRVGQEEEEKFQKEFEQYQQKTQKAREDYIAEHPDAIKPDQQEEYETDEQRELRQIFQGQGQIFEVVRQLHVKMDEIIGKQERTMSLVSAVQGGIPPPVPGQPAPQIAGIDSIRRHEVESLMTGQREVVQNARDIKNSVIDIQSKSNQILTNSQRAQGSVQPAGGAAGGYDMHITLKEMNEGLNIIKRDLGMVNQRLASGPSAAGLASCPSCVSTSVLAIFLIGQLGIVLAYFIYRDSKEANAKKFY